MILVTGGAGFIGSQFVLDWVAQHDEPVLNLDALTYAGNLGNLDALRGDPRHLFVHGDIDDRPLVDRLLREHRPRALLNFAAESHIDRSIGGARAFVRTNVEGTLTLLEAAQAHLAALGPGERDAFRFLQVGTDEVFGSLPPDGAPFTEETPYAPNNPYAASKAAADHLVRAWHRTHALPTLLTHCSNNYGPRQFPEKLIPLMIGNALEGRPIPVYGDGLQRRDWLHVADHCDALRVVLAHGRVGEVYNIGGGNELANLDVVRTVCAILDELRPDPAGPHERLVTRVADRPGHDRRYAISAAKLARELGWRPRRRFDVALRDTVRWYLDHPDWLADVRSGAYRERRWSAA